jgi:hypothetical protein
MRPSKSVILGRAGRLSQCGCKSLELLELTEPLFDGQLQVFPQQGPIDVTFIEFDDGIRREGVGTVIHGRGV